MAQKREQPYAYCMPPSARRMRPRPCRGRPTRWPAQWRGRAIAGKWSRDARRDGPWPMAHARCAVPPSGRQAVGNRPRCRLRGRVGASADGLACGHILPRCYHSEGGEQEGQFGSRTGEIIVNCAQDAAFAFADAHRFRIRLSVKPSHPKHGVGHAHQHLIASSVPRQERSCR